jgi:uncharacterized membrane protein
MATFTVWKFDSAEGAEQALDTLQRLQKEELVQIHDAALVTWPEGKSKPKTRQLHSLAGGGALGGAFWGLLFGLIFFIPLFGMAIGAAAGALGGAMTDVGIDDNFIKTVREQVTPGTSALFLMTSDAVIDKIKPELASMKGHAELIHTNLTNEQETKLHEVFAEDDVLASA